MVYQSKRSLGTFEDFGKPQFQWLLCAKRNCGTLKAKQPRSQLPRNLPKKGPKGDALPLCYGLDLECPRKGSRGTLHTHVVVLL